jgi:predicted Zn-ribbon and HTH transcriptional regulator
MFRLELHELLFVYTGLALAIVLLAAILHNIRRTRREQDALRDVVKCRLCAFEFRDDSGAECPSCPRCGALVNREPLSTL